MRREGERRGEGFGNADARFWVQNLTVEIRELNRIVVDDSDMPCGARELVSC